MSEDYAAAREEQVTLRRSRGQAAPLVFGLTDGTVLFLGLFLGLVIARQPSGALWHAALGGGLAELVGMALGQYWSDPARSKLPALLNGAGACAAAVAPGLPFAALSRGPAVAVSLVLLLALGVVICVLRAEHGWLAVAKTFGLLAVAGLLSGLSGLI